jgi:FkbM family methyltransferase
MPNQVNDKWKAFVSRPLPCLPFIALLKTSRSRPYFIQIGAHDGVSFDDLFPAVTSYGLSGLVVEPVADVFEKLVLNYSPFPLVTPVNVAIDTRRGRRLIHRVSPSAEDMPSFASGISSFDPYHHRKSGIDPSAVVSEEVECVTFGDLCQKYKVERIDYLQLDTEGYDARILSSIDLTRYSPEIIRFEHASLEYEDKVSLAERLADHHYYLLADCENAFAVRRELLRV